MEGVPIKILGRATSIPIRQVSVTFFFESLLNTNTRPDKTETMVVPSVWCPYYPGFTVLSFYLGD